MSELRKVNPHPNNPKGSIVFLHGLNLLGNKEHYKQTWEYIDTSGKEVFWPSILAEEAPTLQVYLADYPADATEWTGDAWGIIDRGVELASQMIAEGIDRKPFVFIAHSLGGLLAKQIMRLSLDDRNGSFGGIFNQCKGLVFFATPHTRL